MGPNGERCTECRKWDYTTGNFGFCRAHAPVPTVCRGTQSDEYQLVWPSTGMDDWCVGDFEKAFDKKTFTRSPTSGKGVSVQ